MSYFSRYKTSHGFMHTLTFEPVPVLEDGLGDDIKAERQEQGITLEETADAEELQNFWSRAVDEARKDPKWNFTGDDDNAPLY